MATQDKRDVQLRVSAVDVNSRKTFKEVAKAIDDVTSSLDDQLAAAKKGQVSTKALTDTLEGLKKANDALLKQQSVVDLYRRQADELDRVEKRQRDAAAAVTTYRTSLEGIEAATRAQTRELKSLEGAEARATKAVDLATRALAQQEDTLRGMGLQYDDLVEAQRQLADASQRVGTAYRATEATLDGYADTLAKVKRSEAALAEEQTFQRKLEDARKLREATSYVTFWTAALDKAADEERAYATQQQATAASIAAAADRRNREAGAVSDFRTASRDNAELERRARYVQDITDALNAQEAQERRLKALDTFQSKATEALAAADRIQQLGQASSQAAAPTQSLANSLRQILQPSTQAVKTLDGLESTLKSIAATIGEADGPIRDYQEAINDLGRVQTAIFKQADSIDAFRQQEESVKRAQQAYEDAQQDVRQYAAAIRSATEPNDSLALSLKKAEGALEAANVELSSQRGRLDALRGSLKATGIDANNLATAENRLKAATDAAAGSIKKLDDANAGKNTGAGRFLGLRAYELQNLSYQINDVFTQIASGTSITQTFAQQGGQIAQLFPRMFAVFLNPAVAAGIVAVTAGLIPLIAAFKNITDMNASVRQFSADLALSADGADYSATKLAQAAHELDVYGMSLKDARAAISAFVKAGLNTDELVRFGKAAQDLADVTGEDVPAAAKRMADGFTGGYKQVAELDEALNFLTAAEREEIKVMFESGRASDARTRAFELFEKRVDSAAEKSRTSWDRIFKALTRTWDGLLTSIGNSRPIQDAIAILESLANAAERAAGALPGVSGSGGIAGMPSAAGGGALPGLRMRAGGTMLGDRFIQSGGRYSEQNRGLLNSLGPVSAFGAKPQIEVTPEIRDIIATVMLEAINDPSAQRDVAAVIMNRIARSGQNGSQVVRAPGQFQPVNDPDTRARWAAITENTEGFAEALENVAPILQGLIADPTNGATMFYSPTGQAANVRQGKSRNLVPNWATPETFVGERDGHRFYNGAFPGDKGRNGGGGITNDTQAGSKESADILARMREEARLADELNVAERERTVQAKARAEIQAAGGSKEQEDQAAALALTRERAKIQKEIERDADALRGNLRQLEGQAQRSAVASLESRMEAIDTQVSGFQEKIDEARKRGNTLDGLSLDDVQARLNAAKEVLKQQETMRYYEEALGDLEEQRAERLERIKADAAAGRMDTAAAFEEAKKVTSELAPQIKSMADAAVAFGEGIRTAEPNARLEAFIASSKTSGVTAADTGRGSALGATAKDLLAQEEETLNRILSERNTIVQSYNDLTGVGGRTATDTAQAVAGAYEESQGAIDGVVARMRVLIAQMVEAKALAPEAAASMTANLARYTPEAQGAEGAGAQLSTRERALNDVIARRNELVQNYNRLVASGQMTTMEAQAATQQAYESTEPLIRDQVNAMQELLDTQSALGNITPELYDTWRSRLQAVGAESVYVSENFTRLKEGMESGFVSAAMGAFEGLLDIVAQLDDGTLEWGDALSALGDVALKFAADFLMSLSQMLVQMALLQAVQSLPFFNGLAKKGASLFDVAPMLVAAPLLSGAGTTLATAGTTLAGAAVPLGVVAIQLSAAAAAMAAAAQLQIVANATGGGLFHGGGVIGNMPANMQRSVHPSVFAGAPRYHSGTVVGLRHDEQAAILQKGEEVLSKGNPRNILNGGAAAGGGSDGGNAALPPIVNNYNLIDAGEVVSEAMNSEAGVTAVVNVMSKNKRRFKQALGMG